MALHWFPFFPGDFIAGTIRLSFDERGTYGLMLVAYYANGGPFPLDLTELYRMIGCESDSNRRSVDRVLQRKFVKTDSGYIHERCETVIAEQLLAHAKRVDAGKKRWSNAQALHEQSMSNQNQNQNQNQKKTSPDPLNAQTWESYRSAYAARYRVDPVRNARVNSQIKGVVQALGSDAPEVADYYLTHNDQWYVKKRHPVGLLLQDCEGLRTQWKTGNRSTSLEARSAEQKDSVVAQIQRVSDNIRRKENAKLAD